MENFIDDVKLRGFSSMVPSLSISPWEIQSSLQQGQKKKGHFSDLMEDYTSFQNEQSTNFHKENIWNQNGFGLFNSTAR